MTYLAALVRTCPRCSRTLPVTRQHFYERGGDRVGFRSYCIDCAIAAQVARAKADPATARRYVAKSRARKRLQKAALVVPA